MREQKNTEHMIPNNNYKQMNEHVLTRQKIRRCITYKQTCIHTVLIYIYTYIYIYIYIMDPSAMVLPRPRCLLLLLCVLHIHLAFGANETDAGRNVKNRSPKPLKP